MSDIICLFRSEFIKFYAELKRYWFETVSYLGIYLIVFLAMFAGMNILSNGKPDLQTLDSLIIGYLSWTISMRAFQSISLFLGIEMQRGTLEQLYLSPFGVGIIMLVRMFYSFIHTVLTSLVILLVIMVITNRYLDINIFRFLFVLSISIPGIWGLGLLLGSLTVIFKRITSLLGMLSFALIGVSVIDALPFTPVSFFPYATGATFMRHMTVHGFKGDPVWFLFIGVNSLVYLLIGIFLFNSLNVVVRKKNSIGVY